ncbi:MAG: ATP-binding protein [Ilumatobacteraceae bacterium]
MTADPFPRTGAWLERGIDIFFVAVIVASAGRDSSRSTVIAVAALLAIYAARLLVRRRESATIVWLWVLTLAWASAVLFVSVALVWVSVSLLFLHLLTFPIRIALTAVAGITAVAITAEALGDGLVAAEVIGPILGAGFAIVACVSYRMLAAEHHEAGRALDELATTRDELARTEHERGMLDERRRVAREVHDTIAQDLAGILLLTRSPESQESMSTIEGLASTALREARRIVEALGPIGLESTSLAVALAQLEATDGTASPSVEFTLTGEPRALPQPHEAMLLRVAQGALANSREHAVASSVFITLSYLDDEVAVDVVDDGCGFDLCNPHRNPPTGSFGLAVMSQRAEQVGGTLIVESHPGGGTAVHAAVPSA